MVAIMRDAIGVGLAATQLGVLRRLLVFQAGPDATPTAVVNPEIEWLSEELAIAEEGCLSLPRDRRRRRAPAPRAGRAALDVERRADPDRGLRPRGAGAPARDRPPRRGPDPRPHRRASSARARCGRCARATATARPSADDAEATERRADAPTREDRLPRHLRVRRRPSCGGSPTRATGRRWSSPRPTGRQGRGRSVAPPPVAAAARELGIELLQTESVNEPEALDADRGPPSPRSGVVCAFGQLIREPLLSELELLNVHPSLLPRWRGAAPIERAIMAGDARTGVASCASPRASTPGRWRSRGACAIEPDDDFGALSARLAELGGELLVRALDLRAARRARVRRAGRGGGDLRGEDRPGRAPPRPGAPGGRAGRDGAGADPAHRRLPGARRTASGSASRRAERRGRASSRRRARGRRRRAAARLRRGRRCGSRVVQPPGGKPMAADAYLRGHPPPASCASSASASRRPARLAFEVAPADLRGRRLHRPRLPRRGRARTTSSGRERAQAQRLAYGAVQRRGTADHLDRAARRAARRPARPAGRWPPCASASTSCSSPTRPPTTPRSTRRSSWRRAACGAAARRTGGPRAGFVNAVLRRAARERDELLAARSDDSTPEGAAVAHSVPRVAGADVVGGARRAEARLAAWRR